MGRHIQSEADIETPFTREDLIRTPIPLCDYIELLILQKNYRLNETESKTAVAAI